MDVKSVITTAKPNISPSSVTAYVSSINNLNKNINDNKPIENFNFLLNTVKVYTYLEKKTYLTRRNLLNAVIVCLKTIEPEPEEVKIYVIDRDRQNLRYEEETSTHEKSSKQLKNWLEYDEIIEIKDKLNKKSTLAQHLFLTIFIENIVRNDYRNLLKITDRKLKQIEKENKSNNIETLPINYFVSYKSNYYIKLNSFKTCKTYKCIKIPIDPIHNKLINKYLRLTPFNKYLFENPKTNTAFTSGEFTLWIEQIFKDTGKKVSSNMLRHILITHFHKDHILLQTEHARVAGHSISTQAKYCKL
jgi:hypothetical protein